MALPDVTAMARDLARVRETLDTLSGQLAQLPEQVGPPAVPAHLEGLLDATRELQTSGEILREGIDFAVAFLGHLRQLRDEFDDERFRGQLDTFLADSAKLSGQISRLLVGFRVPAMLEDGFRKAVIGNVPSVFLLPVSLALDSLPGWEAMPGDLLRTLEKLDPVGKSAQLSEELYTEIIEVRMRLQVLERILETCASLLPSDLSVQLSAVGEGGGTEILGHPIKMPFEAVDLILDLVEVILTSHIEIAQRMAARP